MNELRCEEIGKKLGEFFATPDKGEFAERLIEKLIKELLELLGLTASEASEKERQILLQLFLFGFTDASRAPWEEFNAKLIQDARTSSEEDSRKEKEQELIFQFFKETLALIEACKKEREKFNVFSNKLVEENPEKTEN